MNWREYDLLYNTQEILQLIKKARDPHILFVKLIIKIDIYLIMKKYISKVHFTGINYGYTW